MTIPLHSSEHGVVFIPDSVMEKHLTGKEVENPDLFDELALDTARLLGMVGSRISVYIYLSGSGECEEFTFGYAYTRNESDAQALGAELAKKVQVIKVVKPLDMTK